MFSFNKLCVLMFFVLTGCVSQPIPSELLNSQRQFNNDTDAFLILVTTMLQNKITSIYSNPVSKDSWIYINDTDGIHYYLNRKNVVIDKQRNMIIFTSLYDLRDTEYAEKKLLYYVSYDSVINCKTNVFSVIQRNLIDATNTTTSRFIRLPDDFDTKTINGSVGEDMCFILMVMQK